MPNERVYWGFALPFAVMKVQILVEHFPTHSKIRKKIFFRPQKGYGVKILHCKIYGNARDASVNTYPTEAFMRYPKVKKITISYSQVRIFNH